MKTPRWIDRRALLLLHEETLAEHGGPRGFRDEGIFDASLARPQHVHTYKAKADLARLAAAYGFGLVRNHPFNDGNKRIGFMAIGLFLALNGYELKAGPVEATQTILQLAAGEVSEAKLADWIRGRIVRQR